MSDATLERVERLAALLRTSGGRLVTAESCTGGLLAAACTSVAGSSDWFERGFVTYSNAAKSELLGVAPQTIVAHGAVSPEVATAMAEGALAASAASLAVAVTGVAGPGGGTVAKPVGTVWIGLAGRAFAAHAVLLQATGDRTSIRTQSVARALALLVEAAGGEIGR
ncbi:MAG: CinA family protein [Caldimonas sp.]